MTNLEHHCTSKDLAIALRDSGYKQEGHQFYWFDEDHPFIHDEDFFVTSAGLMLDAVCVAPLASEILEELPEYTFVQKRNGVWHCELHDSDIEQMPWTSDESLPDALAKLYLSLEKNGYLKK